MDKINTTIKPIDRDKASSELEKNEVVFDPNKLTLHRVLGNPHSKGGTPVNLNDGSFIFSNYSKLSFNKRDKELMEFKEGGSLAKRKNTPAKVLEKEIDIKNHNSMVNVLNKNVVDPILNNSAMLMVQKNLEKIGQVAFKQEEKKGFPKGIPFISQNTSPVYSPQIEEEMDKSEQYQSGGFAKRAKYTPSFKPYDPKNLPDGYGDPTYLNDLSQWSNSLYNYNLGTGADAIKKMREWQFKNVPWAVKAAGDMGYWNKNASFDYNYKDPRVKYDLFGYQAAQPINQSEWTPLDKDKYGDNRYYKVDPQTGRAIFTEGQPGLKSRTDKLDILQTKNPELTSLNLPDFIKNQQGNKPGDTDLPTVAKQYDVGFTDWQKLNIGLPFLRAASVKTYLPLRQQQESVIPQPELLSAQPYLNQNNQGYFNASQLAKISQNPEQVIQALAGSRLDANNQAIGNVENQNVQILNSWKNLASQTLNNDAGQNRQFDRTYYDQTITALQNRDDMRSQLTNQGISNLNDFASQREAVNQYLNSQQQVKTNIPIKDKNGVILGYESGLPYEPTKNFFGFNLKYNQNLDPRSILNYRTSFGSDQKDEYIQKSIQWALDNLSSDNENTKKSAALILSRYINNQRNR